MKLHALRQKLRVLGLDGMIIPRGDAFGGEEVAASDERLAFISGFTGSAGVGVVLADTAVLFSDGRYSLQMEAETDGDWHCITGAQDALIEWLAVHAKGKVLGLDGWLMPLKFYHLLSEELADWVALRPIDTNPIDALWEGQPPPPSSPAFAFPDAVAGLSRGDKIEAICSEIRALGGGSLLISDPADLAWLLNIRGRDLAHTPVILAFAVLELSGRVTVFTDGERFADCDTVGLHFAPADTLPDTIETLDAKPMLIDPATCPVVLRQRLKGQAIQKPSPIAKSKAIKTESEIEAITHAHRCDGVALVRFLHWFDSTIATVPIREAEVADRLLEFRKMSPDFICPSFATICGSGANGAIVHYHAKSGQDQAIPPNSLCLIDSGGQYHHATTDVTRTLATGTVTTAMTHHFTQVLKAHIALARCRFPPNTTGVQLDAVARATLWQAGMDYAHGTGHGVGCCLGVHEGPAHISPRSPQVIESGMVLSNEPGFYRVGHYGIRIENLMVIRRNEGDSMLYSTPLTLVPIDRRLIEVARLEGGEKDWLNAYHQRVRGEILPLLEDSEGGAADWLIKATEAI